MMWKAQTNIGRALIVQFHPGRDARHDILY